MAYTTTTNYGLKKGSGGSGQTVEQQRVYDNENADTIDSTMKTISDAADAAQADADTAQASADTAQGEVDALEILVSTNRTIINEKTSYGVYAGLVVAQQTVADMTVKCSAGTIYMENGDRFTPSAVASIAVTAADATNPRIDIVYVSSVGAITYLVGTAAATPSAPSVPSGGQKLYEINVAAGVTTILADSIVDKRKTLIGEAWVTPTLINNWVALSINEHVAFCKDSMGIVHLRGAVKDGTSDTVIFTLPSGYRPVQPSAFAVPSSSCFGTACTIRIDYNGNYWWGTGTVSVVGTDLTRVDLSGIQFSTV